MSFTDEPKPNPHYLKKVGAAKREFEARAAALRKDLGLPPEPKKVQGKGTAYPVGSERHDEAPGPPAMIPVGPVNVPTSRYKVEHAIKFSLEQIEGLFLRQSKVNNPELFEMLDSSELSSVQFKTLKDRAGLKDDTYVLIGTFVYRRPDE